MKSLSNGQLFGGAILLGLCVVLGLLAYDRLPTKPEIKTYSLQDEISVTEQLSLKDLEQVQIRNFATVIDLRPDGEAPDQPSSQAVAAAAQQLNLKFSYIPVPHGDAVPDAAVLALSDAIANSPKPILLYCRSGRRAVRAWSLAEASRPGGADAATILAAAQSSGQAVDDLRTQIDARIAQRPAGTP